METDGTALDRRPPGGGDLSSYLRGNDELGLLQCSYHRDYLKLVFHQLQKFVACIDIRAEGA